MINQILPAIRLISHQPSGASEQRIAQFYYVILFNFLLVFLIILLIVLVIRCVTFISLAN